MTPIPFAPGYFVTENGEVWSTRRRPLHKLNPFFDADGYLRVGLCVGGKLFPKGVHVLVCVTFNGPPHSEGLEVRHLDGNKTNNVPQNLAWGTRKENAQDMMRHGGHRAHVKPDSYKNVGAAISAAQKEAWKRRKAAVNK